MGEPGSAEGIQPTVGAENTELALAYIERRRIEIGVTFAARREGVAELPLGWRSFGRPSESVLRHLRISAEADEAFLGWLREQVVEGNAAWTEQLAQQQRDWKKSPKGRSQPWRDAPLLGRRDGRVR